MWHLGTYALVEPNNSKPSTIQKQAKSKMTMWIPKFQKPLETRELGETRPFKSSNNLDLCKWHILRSQHIQPLLHIPGKK